MPPHSRRGTRRGGDAHVPQGWENGAPREKSGQVGSQSVDKSLPLSAVLISLQHTEITAKIIQSQGTQPTDQAVINHIPLMVGQHDPCTLVD
ncbi:hypothetical protein SEEC0006_09089 [Salmonella enterica subsp. enterica serovar Choleraesuis str. 0006]|nr:hypothetical protein SEEK0253_13100 [Salmonella enterica subsp. enterica serovar Kentucky str. 0253]ESH56873.1 hypothetical protein SEEC0006_09089 [Salmonella enterica subsp. enterica serovar Choleraesuis str. 0006]